MVLEQFIIDADIIWDQVGKTFFENPEAKPGRIMRVQVVNAGIIEDLTGYTLNLGWTSVRDPSKFGLDAFDDVDITKGIFEIEYTSGMLTNIGPLNASLQLVPPGEGRPIESNNFKLAVKNSAINPGAIQGETSFSTLENALVEVNGWNARIDVVEQEFKDRADALDGSYPTRLVSVETALTEKLDKGEIKVGDINKNYGLIDETYLADSLRQQIAGTAPIHATPARHSITMDKLALSPIVGEASKNMFDKNTVSIGYIINATTGLPTTSENFTISDFILADANTQYVVNSSQDTLIHFYNDAEEHLSFHNVSGGTSFTNPANTKYIRVRFPNTMLDKLQLETGTTSTSYEPHVNYLKKEAFRPKTFSIEALEEYSIGKNLYNKDDILLDIFVSGSGATSSNTGYVSTKKIPIDPTRLNLAVQFGTTWFSFYGSEQNYVSGGTGTTIAIPSNAYYVIISFAKTSKDTQQLEYGTNFTTYENYGYKLNKLIPPEVEIDLPSSKKNKIHTLKSAMVRWENGEKFPVLIQGDSTVDGVATTGRLNGYHQDEDDAAGGRGRADYQPPNAFTSVLQNMIREETGLTVARIYNGGYSGTALQEGKLWLDDLLGYAYSDTKMLGVMYGYNDKARYTTKAAFETGFRNDLIYTVEYCFNRGIQPFMITSQAAVDSGHPSSTTFDVRTSEALNSIGNRVKKEVAEEYGLEVIDLSAFGELLLNHSNEPVTNIIGDKVHFGDYGNKKEAQYLFKEISPRVVSVQKGDILTFASQKIQSDFPMDYLTYLPSIDSDGFKLVANRTQTEATDVLIQDFWVYNGTKDDLILKAYVTAAGSQYVNIDGVTQPITANGQVVATLDIGTYHVQVFSGANTKVDFKGFKVL